ncbi:MAG TPA: hypothetical protein VIF64_11090 [Pyrinomonadaceae bacterium]|jgi:hypothetical protein
MKISRLSAFVPLQFNLGFVSFILHPSSFILPDNASRITFI